jgi:hypothetical protein
VLVSDELTDEPDAVEFIGPIEYHAVVVHGRRVPYLTAAPMPGGMVSLTLDNRFGVDLSVHDAQTLVPFIANCIAVATGYSGFPERGWDALPAVPMPRMTPLEEV